MEVLHVIEARPLPFLCELRREIVRSPGYSAYSDDDSEEAREILAALNCGPADFERVAGYAKDGSYIGDEKTTRFIVLECKISPEKASSERQVCSIGWCDNERKWYGWSHRALCGFGVGSVVKYGDCAETAPTLPTIRDRTHKRLRGAALASSDARKLDELAARICNYRSAMMPAVTVAMGDV